MVDISIIIPAFNEAGRIPNFLEDLAAFCARSQKSYEVLVVDDGSTDGTASAVEAFRPKLPALRLIRIDENHGKGYAVKKGLLEGSGKIRAFMDADGSFHPDQIERNLHYLTEDGFDIFVGSRLRGENRGPKTYRYRKALGCAFNLLTRFLLLREIRDTQCGFKMFRADVVEPLFSRSRLPGYGFDMEILYLALRMGYKIKEAPVSWKHIRGSKVNVLTEPIRLILNIFQIKRWHRRVL